MAFSLFDLFKVGIGPSSSHTVGPMRAAAAFVAELEGLPVAALRVELCGSLAWTGKGHATDRAVILGLLGERPDTVLPEDIDGLVTDLAERGALSIAGRAVPFEAARDIVFDFEAETPAHPNTMRFVAFDAEGAALRDERWCSVGGGAIAREAEVGVAIPGQDALPFPYASAADLMRLSAASGLSIAEMVRANECALRPAAAVDAYLDVIVAAMMACIDRGMRQEGLLPGRLNVRRRASGLRQRLEADRFRNRSAPHAIMDHISLFAIAVNEENAAGGRIVTAPTNGAAGVLPAVLRYYRDFYPGASAAGLHRMLLTATAIGALCKRNASISGAEVGCQGEVGTACAMAAAGLAAALDGTTAQIENAAEIAMEHHLGMTCDPIGGLVQVPCIERNAFGAIKAINAASLALRGDGTHLVSLDHVIATMRQTGLDMQSKYKETSRGGLAVNFPEC